MTTDHSAILRQAAQHWRADRRADARALVVDAVDRYPTDVTLLGFAGLLACQDDDPAAGADFLRRALAIEPGDQANRANLLTALIALDAIDEAAALAGAADSSNPRVARSLGYIAQRQDRHADAARLYAAVVLAIPDDAQSWNNLGNARAALGDTAGALHAFERAVLLRADDPVPWINASKALAKAELHARRRSWVRDAAAAVPGDRAIWVEVGLAEAAERDFPAAEAALRRAIAIQPDHAEAYVELGLLLENLNRIDDLDALVSSALDHGIPHGEIALVAGWLARRRGRWEEAAEWAAQVGDEVIPLRRHHLLADIADRTGDATNAFAEFERMNAGTLALAVPVAGPTYLERVLAQTALLARDGIDAIGPAATELTPPSPIFIVGFPRSGTTLLDTLLMNDGRFHVLEEMPMLPRVEEEVAREGGIRYADADVFRRRYFEFVGDIAPAPAGATIIDKFPLHLARLPLLHRLFPDAKVILVERHPCDVVLSCFMANFQPNHAMRHFTTLRGAAELYDAVFTSFEQATALLPINIHRIRYERMVADLEGEMRALMAFVGASWNPAVLDNQAAAASRDHIRTASYSQVTEPIYRRAAGRWERYRTSMAEVLPILAPWCDRFSYDLPPG